MDRNSTSRRDFLAAAAFSAAGLAVTAAGSRAAGQPPAAGPLGAGAAPLEKRQFGKTGMNVTILGFGGAEIGYERTDQATVDTLLNAALDAGLNVVDTAECYVDSEVQIGKAIGHRRAEFYLFTKCGHITEAGTRGDAWSKKEVLASIERSLTRLKTDAIDLVQLHSCPVEVLQKGECIEGLEEAKKQGKTRFIGYSGDSLAAKFAVETGRFDALQTSVNILDQESIELTLPLARERQMGVVAKRPIANAVWRYDARPENAYHQSYYDRLDKLKYAFASGDARSNQTADGPAGIAMRFTAMQSGVHVLIVGTSKPERWRQNADLMRAGPLPAEVERSIRDRWKAAAGADWIGQI